MRGTDPIETIMDLMLEDQSRVDTIYFLMSDVLVFDPEKIADLATYEKPQQYAVGVKQVFVNGVQVLKDGEHTGANPGRALWGPGKIRNQAPIIRRDHNSSHYLF